VGYWQNRSVRTIEKCKGCKYDVICGGGCGVVAANKNGGEILSPDCRPIQEIAEIGINHYIDSIREMTEPASEESPVDASSTAASCCGTGEKVSGCVICGSMLAYATQPSHEKCVICGKSFDTNVSCKNGHYVCDACHSSDILTRVERCLIQSAETDPVALVKKVFDLPGLKIHGPEYHSIVPAVLVAAYHNKNKTSKLEDIREAIRRGKDVKGGSCGYSGGCGAAIGTGVAASILGKATPMSDIERGNALRQSGGALLAISRHGGPRCCKRDAVTSIQSFVQSSGYFSDTENNRYVCRHFKDNKDCIGTRCPYFPKVKITVKGK
jgi:hypothetical protein